MKTTKHSLYAISALLVLSHCAGNTKKDAALNDHASDDQAKASAAAASKDAVSIEAKMVGAQQGTSNVTEVRFEKGSIEVSKSASEKLENALIAAEKKDRLKRVTLVVWSDTEMPKGESDLSASDIALAADRGQALIHLVESKREGLKIQVVNMAEKPGKIKKFLKTDDVRIEEALETAGHGDPKASRAVIIIETKRKI